MGTKMKHRKARTGMNVLTSCISTTLVLVLLGTVVFFVTLAHNFSNSLKENFNVSLLLDDDVTQKQAYDLQTRLKQMPCTRLVNYVSKERALKEQAKALGTDPTEFMKENPMPAAFEVYLKAEYATNDSLKHIIPQLKADKAVMELVHSNPEAANAYGVALYFTALDNKDAAAELQAVSLLQKAAREGSEAAAQNLKGIEIYGPARKEYEAWQEAMKEK